MKVKGYISFDCSFLEDVSPPSRSYRCKHHLTSEGLEDEDSIPYPHLIR